eukprot:3628767-Pleurochrysis_carterae.AAC.1
MPASQPARPCLSASAASRLAARLLARACATCASVHARLRESVRAGARGPGLLRLRWSLRDDADARA